MVGTNAAGFGPSGFFQTSRDRGLVEERYLFGNTGALGVLFVIDGLGAELLDADALTAWLHRDEPERSSETLSLEVDV